MNEILLLIAGLICGFLSSSPLGTINFWLIDQTLHQKKNLLPLLLGVVCADLIYAALAAWGFQSLLLGSMLGKWVAAAGGALLIVLGIFSLKSKPNDGLTVSLTSTDSAGRWPYRKFLLGLVMCGSNPAFLLFWIFAMSTLNSRFTIDFSGMSLGFFLIGIAVGDLSWFATLILLVRKLRKKINGDFTQMISRAVAAVLIAIGSYSILNLFSA